MCLASAAAYDAVPAGVSTFRQLVSVEGVCDLVGLEHGEFQQVVGWRRGKGGVLFGGESSQTVP